MKITLNNLTVQELSAITQALNGIKPDMDRVSQIVKEALNTEELLKQACERGLALEAEIKTLRTQAVADANKYNEALIRQTKTEMELDNMRQELAEEVKTSYRMKNP